MKNLFVGNLGPEVTHEELRRLFEAYGQVVQVHIIVDRDTGLPRGFAFVEMTNDAEAEKAIKALTGRELRSTPTRTPSSIDEREPRLHGLRDLTFFLHGLVARCVLFRNPGRSQAGASPHPT